MITRKDGRSRSERLRGNRVASKARKVLEDNPLFHGRTDLIQIEEIGGTLVLQGRLPTYYLKQMLQTVLRDLDGVHAIDNRVAVDLPIEQ